MLGNFLTDFLRLSEIPALPYGMQKGVALHRYIDDLMDSHLIIRSSKKLLYPRFGKYVPVVMDVYYDYFLHKNFGRFHHLSPDHFAEEVYDAIIAQFDYIPIRLQDRVQRMLDGRWLAVYGHYDGLEMVFQRLDKRASFETGFDEAVNYLQEQEMVLESEFLEVFPDILEKCKMHKKQLLKG